MSTVEPTPRDRRASCECGHKGFNHGFGDVCLYSTCECMKFRLAEPTPRAVSEEDRHAAAELVRHHEVDIDRTPLGAFCMCGKKIGWDHRSWVAHRVDALISHGWGPKPTVSATTLAEIGWEFYAAVGQDGYVAAMVKLDAYMRERGLVVTK